MKRFLFIILLVSVWFSPCLLLASENLAKEYERNGEVYIAVSHESDRRRPPQYHPLSWIYRLNDPAGELGSPSFPQSLIRASESKAVNSLVVDLNRTIFTLSDPDVKPISDEYKLIRQVLDHSFEVDKDKARLWSDPADYTYWSSHGVKSLPLLKSKLSEPASDYGRHAYPHHDSRTLGRGTPVYRTVIDGGSRKSHLHNLVTIKQGDKVSAPSDPVSHMPDITRSSIFFDGTCPCGQKHYDDEGNKIKDFTTEELAMIAKYALPPFDGKAWYEIPNNAWYGLWKVNPRRKGYIVYTDRVTGDQLEWKKHEWRPKNSSCSFYSRTSSSDDPYTITYDAKLVREIRNGCLDSCSTGVGSLDIKEPPMICHSAFMPYSKNPGVTTDTDVRVYTYKRSEGRSDGNLSLEGTPPPGGREEYPVTDNGKVLKDGHNKNDVKWIGVSRGKGGKDYVYYLGNSNIAYLCGQSSNLSSSFVVDNMDIKAVSVSNQWDEEGGIIFAYNQFKGGNQKPKIYEIKMRGKNMPYFNSRDLSSALANIGTSSDAEIDELAADGFGRLFLSMTYPSKQPKLSDPEDMKLDLSKAYKCKTPTSAGDTTGTFYFKVPYRKSVWMLAYKGKPDEEVGSVKLGEVEFTRQVDMPKAAWNKVISSPPTSWQTIYDEAKADGGITSMEPFQISSNVSADLSMFDSKLAVINAPTPPQVYSLYGKKSYIDILGVYTMNDFPKPKPDMYDTGQFEAMGKLKDPGNISLAELYFFMVDNYPLGTGVQNPNAKPDNDGDGRVSGFVSTIKTNPDNALRPIEVDYRWKIWKVMDTYVVNGKETRKVVDPPELYMDSADYFSVLYSLATEGYIITCVASCSFYDYTTVLPGQTYSDWMATNPLKSHMAIPTASQLAFAPGMQPLREDPGVRVKKLLAKIYSSPNNSLEPAALQGNKEINSVASQILAGDEGQWAAVEYAMTSGKVVLDPGPMVFQLERCDHKNSINNNDAWFKSQPVDPNNNSDDYHGVLPDHKYMWRVDVDHQAMYFDDLQNQNSPYYKDLVKKLTDPNSDMYVNADPACRFDPGNNLYWDPAPPTVNAYMDYKTIKKDANGNAYEEVLTMPINQANQQLSIGTDSSTVPARQFAYVGTDNLPITDPYEGVITVEMRRMLYYESYLYYPDGSLITNTPLKLPIPVSVYSKGKVVVIDPSPSSILYSKTETGNSAGSGAPAAGSGFANGSPIGKYQIAGITNQPLSGTISFTVEDSNIWEYRNQDAGDAIQPHKDCVVGGSDDSVVVNKPKIANLRKGLGDANTNNLRPVFSNERRYVRLRTNMGDYSINNDTWIITPPANDVVMPVSGSSANSSAGTGWKEYMYYGDKGSINQGGINGIDIVGRDFAIENSSSALYKPPARLKFNADLSRFGLVVPGNYANNTPGYEPYKFSIEVCDSSGNVLEERPLNAVVQVADNIPPYPYFTVKEFKSGNLVRVPGLKVNNVEPQAGTSIGNSSDPWFKAFVGNVMMNPSDYPKGTVLPYDMRGEWVSDPSTGQLFSVPPVSGSSVFRKDAYALPFINSSIVPLYADTYTQGFVGLNPNPVIPPGNLIVEDNVEVIFNVGASDNSGAAEASIEVKYFDLSGVEKTMSIEKDNLWQSPGTGSTGMASYASGVRGHRVLFRRGRGNNAVTFPMVIPVVVKTKDNARTHSYYKDGCAGGSEHGDDWDGKWGAWVPGQNSSNERVFKSSIPVFGSSMDIRTLDKQLTPRSSN